MDLDRSNNIKSRKVVVNNLDTNGIMVLYPIFYFRLTLIRVLYNLYPYLILDVYDRFIVCVIDYRREENV